MWILGRILLRNGEGLLNTFLFFQTPWIILPPHPAPEKICAADMSLSDPPKKHLDDTAPQQERINPSVKSFSLQYGISILYILREVVALMDQPRPIC